MYQIIEKIWKEFKISVPLENLDDGTIYDIQLERLQQGQVILQEQKDELLNMLDHWKNEPEETKGKKELKLY